MSKPIIPQLGMGVTQYFMSDCAPWTVVRVFSANRVMIAQDTPHPIDQKLRKEYSMPDQEFDFELATGERIEISLRKNGRWHTVGKDTNEGCQFTLGKRRYYRDPSF